ncbi:MAG: hypothetical protein K0U41_08905 [Gammaproteobacteria bacterium]|nr:hypothetical protein [Gammaproteobacteria bacterium]
MTDTDKELIATLTRDRDAAIERVRELELEVLSLRTQVRTMNQSNPPEPRACTCARSK